MTTHSNTNSLDEEITARKNNPTKTIEHTFKDPDGYRGRSIHLNPNFVLAGNNTMMRAFFDLALIWIVEPIAFSEYVRPATLSETPTADDTKGTMMTSSWDRTSEEGQISVETLYKMDVTSQWLDYGTYGPMGVRDKVFFYSDAFNSIFFHKNIKIRYLYFSYWR